MNLWELSISGKLLGGGKKKKKEEDGGGRGGRKRLIQLPLHRYDRVQEDGRWRKWRKGPYPALSWSAGSAV
jgi:hypothetical protein